MTLAAAGIGALAATAPVDEVELNFSTGGLVLLNVILGLIMFGIALDIDIGEIRRVLATPRAFVIGLVAQFLLLPAATFLLTQLLDPAPSIALGMILVGSCPGGNVSNFLAHVSKSNTVLSIGMTAASTAASAVMTPLNFSFWGSLDPETGALLRSVAVDPVQLVVTIALLLGVPVALGVWIQSRRPDLAARLHPPIRRASIVFFIGFVVAAFASNWQNFLDYIGFVAFAVLIHNALALSGGYAAARTVRLPRRDARAISLEVGIQNSALALALIFTFFSGLGGMALVAAWWGVWHLISGGALAWYWSRRPVPKPPAPDSVATAS